MQKRMKEPKTKRYLLSLSLKFFGVFLNMVLAAGGTGILAWSFSNGNRMLSYFAGPAAAAIIGYLWYRQHRTEDRNLQAAKRLRRWILGVQSASILMILAISVIQMYRVGYLPPIQNDRQANFERLWQAMERNYAYFEIKDVDWHEAHDRYLARIQAADSNREYYLALNDMLLELNDAHTHLNNIPGERFCRFALAEEIQGQAVVTLVGTQAAEAGLEIGDIIRQVNGQSVEEAIQTLPQIFRNGSSPWQRRMRAFQFLLITPVDMSKQMMIEKANGEEKSLTLPCQPDPSARSEQPEPNIEWERLPSGVGLIRIPTFGLNLVDEFNAALNQMMNAPGIILDVRNNGGGATWNADPIAGRFQAQPFTYGTDQFRQRLPLRGWIASLDFRLSPRQPVYHGPVALLIDTENMTVHRLAGGK